MQLLQDRIAEDDNEFWPGLSTFTDTLYDHILSIKDGSPILLSGDWGSGKSSVLAKIQSHSGVKQAGDERSLIFITFEAWRYEQEGNLLTCLMRCIWQHVADGRANNLFHELLALTSVLAGISQPITKMRGLDKTIKKLTPKAMKSDYENTLAEVNQVPSISVTDKLIERFYEILETYFDKQQVVILIDDLDRCSPESALVLLDSMRMLIHGLEPKKNSKSAIVQAKVQFVVAMDQVTVKEMVANKFNNLDSFEANRYLEKLFPFVFKIPQLTASEVHKFLDKNIQDLDQNQELFESKYQDLIFNALLSPSFMNPRLIKRCLNKIAMFLNQEQKPSGEYQLSDKDFEFICIWIPATERWPNFRLLVLRKPFSFWQQLKEQLDHSEVITDPEAAELLVQKGFKEFFSQHMADDVEDARQRFNDAELRLAVYGL